MPRIIELKVGALRLYEEQDAFRMISGSWNQEELLRHIISQNLYGKLPLVKNILKNTKLSDNRFYDARDGLVSKGLLLQTSIAEVVKEYHHFEKWHLEVEKTVGFALGELVVGELRSSRGNRRSWEEKFKDYNSFHYPRCYLALITQRGLPVFNSIFPGLHYTALATLKDVPLFIKYFPNLGNATNIQKA